MDLMQDTFTASRLTMAQLGNLRSRWHIGRLHPIPDREPAGWKLVDLTSVATLESGHTPSRSNPGYWNGTIPWVSLHDSQALEVPSINATAQSVTKLGIANSSARLLPEGTVIFSRTATVGKCTILGREMATSQDFANYVCGDHLHNRYLMYLFRFMQPEWKRLMAGSTHNTIYMPVFRAIQILLPPIAEQQAIASVLSDVDELIGALDMLIAKKRAIKLAAMQQLLSGKTRLPGFKGEWRFCKLGDVGQFSKGRGIKRDDVSDSGVGCIRYGELYTRYENYISYPVSRIPPAVAQTALPIRSGDLLFAGSGETAEEIGKCAAYVGEEEAYAGGDIVVLTPFEQNPFYLGHLTNHRDVAEQKARFGQGDAVVHISARNLALIDVQLPPKEEQDAIAEVLLDMDAEIAGLEQRLDKTKAIKQGMLQSLLTGRVRLVAPEATP